MEVKRSACGTHLLCAKAASAFGNIRRTRGKILPTVVRIGRNRNVVYAFRPQQFLYFFPDPQGHGALRPGFFFPAGAGRLDFGASVVVIEPPLG
jgi:hypothetical protein